MKPSHLPPVNGHHLESALDVMRKARLRITRPRQVLLRILIQEHGPFTMEELRRKMHKEACNLVTVYRCLDKLEESGLVKRCDFGDGICRYEFSGDVSHHHHHIICKHCRKVEMLDGCLVAELEKLVRERGYAEVGHSLEFFGICPVCQKKDG